MSEQKHATAPAACGDGLPATLTAVVAELQRATAKFPTWPEDPLHAIAVLGEEYGELVQAILRHTYEPHKSDLAAVRTEALQTAAMAIRFLLGFEQYRFAPGVQVAQAVPTAPEPPPAPLSPPATPQFTVTHDDAGCALLRYQDGRVFRLRQFGLDHLWGTAPDNEALCETLSQPVQGSVQAPADGDHWVMHCPVLSTAHLQQQTVWRLEIIKDGFNEFGTRGFNYPEGVMFRCGDDPDLDSKDLPEDLRTCIAWARARHYVWIRFDCDGDEIAGLPQYEWADAPAAASA